MQKTRTRREFLADVGRGVLISTVGCQVATELGLASAFAEDAPDTLAFGAIEPNDCRIVLSSAVPVRRRLGA